LNIPIPPSLDGRVKRALILSFGGGLLVIAGNSSDLMKASKGCKNSLIFGVVRLR